MTNLMDTTAPPTDQSQTCASPLNLKSKMPLNAQDQNTQEAPSTRVISLKEKIQKSNLAKFTADKEQEDFVKRLIEFHRHRNVGTPLAQWPTLNGAAIDLYKLYMKVISLGGWERVSEKNKWDDVWQELAADMDLKACFNGDHAIKLIYIRYLSLYEKFEAYWSDLDEKASKSQSLASMLNNSTGFFVAHSKLSTDNDKFAAADETSLVNRRRFSYLFEAVPMNYNTNQHAISSFNLTNSDDQQDLNSDTSQQHQLARLAYNPYEKLEQSLMSGLPNEIDFVFNTIMLLSGDEFHGFKIHQSPRIVDLMLAHIGFFGILTTAKYRHLYDNVWHCPQSTDYQEGFNFGRPTPNSTKTRPRNYVKFWHNAVKLPNDSNKALIEKLLPKMYNEYLTRLPEQELMNLRDDTIHQNSSPNTASVEYRRIEQVMITLNNLSFEEGNAEYMANRNSTLYEFLIMCLFCGGDECYVELKKHALDIFTNISRRMKIEKMSENHKCMLLVSLDYLINGQHGYRNLPNPYFEGGHLANSTSDSAQSQDKFDIIRGLEVLTKMCSQKVDPTDTEDYLNELILSTSHVVCQKTNDMTTYKLETIEPLPAESSDLMQHENMEQLFLNRILCCLEHLLSLQDIFVLLHSLECLYNMSQFSQNVCEMIVSYKADGSTVPRIVGILANLLTIDMTHFGMSTNGPDMAFTRSQKLANGQAVSNVPLKMYKVVSTNSIVAGGSNQATNVSQTTNSSVTKGSLLQQTLNNQHCAVITNSPNITATKINNNQTAQPNLASASKSVTSPEQVAKNVLCNWLRTCFQMDSTSEISKTKLYPYYQQIAKINNWSVLTIPTFFEILNATFPTLRYHDNQIIGLKLVVNIKQQLQMKKDDLIKESSETWTSQSANVKCRTNSPTKNAMSSNTLNATKIKYLLNPSSMPKEAVVIPKQVSIGNCEQKKQLVNKLEEVGEKTEKIIDNSIGFSEIKITAAPIVPILSPPSKLDTTKSLNGLSNSLSLAKSEEEKKKTPTELCNAKKPSLSDEIGCLKKVVDKIPDQVLNGHAKQSLDKPLNGLCNLATDLENRSNKQSFIKSSSESSSENEDMINEVKLKLNCNKENNEEFGKKRKHENEIVSGESMIVEQTSSEQNAADNGVKKVCGQGEEKMATNTSQDCSVRIEESTDKVSETESTTAPIPPTIKPPVQSQQSIIIQPVKEPVQQQPVQHTPQTNVVTNPTSNQTPQSQPSTNPQSNKNLNQGIGGDFLCEWNNCKSSFHTVTQIYNHVYSFHLLNSTEVTNNSGQLCQWAGCDQIRRQKWSLINHLQEKHCNENALKTALNNRQQGIVPPPVNSITASAINTKDAALIAIQRHQKKNMDEFWVANEEGPLTKSIRLLSALTLRNLARNSERAKVCVKPYEPTLTTIAFDLMESSNTVANCLWYLAN